MSAGLVAENRSSLRHRTLTGGFWLLLSDILSQGLGLLRAVIFSHLLAPGDFGLFGIALLVQRWIDAFTETGVTAALVQKKGKVEPYLSTVLWLQFGRAALVAGSVLILAPWAGVFFHNAEAPAMIRCLALSTILWAFTNPGVVCLRRELRFRTDVLWRFSNVITSLVVAVVACLVLRNAWGLAIGLVAGQAAQAATSYMAHPFRPGFRFEWRLARELLRFGRYITATNILTFLDLQIDSIATGRFLGATALGYYQMAAQFTNPVVRIGNLLNGLLFPALCQVEDEDSRRAAFLRVIGPVATVLLPAGFVFAAVAGIALTTVLGDQWVTSASLAGILIWSALARSMSACTTSMLLATGKTRVLFCSQLVKIASMAVLGYWLMSVYGLRGIAVAAAFSAVIAFGQQLIATAMATGVPLTALLQAFRASLLVSTPGLAALLIWRWSAIAGAIVLLAVAIPCYVVLVWRTAAPLLRGVRGLPETCAGPIES